MLELSTRYRNVRKLLDLGDWATLKYLVHPFLLLIHRKICNLRRKLQNHWVEKEALMDFGI